MPMGEKTDQLINLIPAQLRGTMEQMNMPYTGYYFLRETLSTTMLGESEAPILYWMGKDIGGKIPIDSPEDLILPFMRLGLGKLEVADQSKQEIAFTLDHSLFAQLPQDRLPKMLSLETGIITGAISQWLGQQADGQLEIHQNQTLKTLQAHIRVVL
ncbi:DUF2507 domain-containing protein [Brevibacillus dissolubilis]|uniref:DUF2507 domain-containing protein n=1 Tax=Brevibacillus dissolubilis TaxID=1844116 RepID=UPI0021000728|nr:DUF2507 domain-containing protein [Brevibacillus dissolubilis]